MPAAASDRWAPSVNSWMASTSTRRSRTSARISAGSASPPHIFVDITVRVGPSAVAGAPKPRGNRHAPSTATANPSTAAERHRRAPSSPPSASTAATPTYGVKARSCTRGWPSSMPVARTSAKPAKPTAISHALTWPALAHAPVDMPGRLSEPGNLADCPGRGASVSVRP